MQCRQMTGRTLSLTKTNFVTYKRYLDGWQGLGELGRLEKQLSASDSTPARHQLGTPWNHLLLC
jgi:hypothetical protein